MTRFAALLTLSLMVGGCRNTPDLGFAVALTLQFDNSVTDSALGEMRAIEFASVAEGFTDTIALPSSGAKRTETIVYHPLVTTTQLTLEATAVDGDEVVLAAGKTDLTLTPGKTAVDTLTLYAPNVSDAGIDLGLDGYDGDSGADGSPAGHDLSVPGDAAMAPCTQYASVGDDLNTMIAAMKPGDVLCLNAGTYTGQVLYITNSGTATSPITIRSTNPAQHAVLDGQYVYPNSTAYNNASGTGGPCTESTANTNPSSSTTVCFVYDPLVTIVANYVVWSGVDITRSRGRGLSVNGQQSSDVYTGVRVLDSDIGLTRVNGIVVANARAQVDGNSVHESGSGAAYVTVSGAMGILVDYVIGGVEITNNTVYHCYGAGIVVGLFGLVSSTQVAHNVLYDNTLAHISVAFTDDVTIDSNLAYQTTDTSWLSGNTTQNDCFSAEGQNSNTINNTTFSNNIADGCYTLMAIRVNGSTTVSNMHLYFNTLARPAPGGAALYNNMTTGLTGLTITDNLVYVTAGVAIESTFATPAGITASNNLWPHTPTAALYNSTTDVINATPGLAKPAYVPVAGAFDATTMKLLAGSPAIDKGVDVSITTDYFGDKRPQGAAYDIGADEL